MSPASSLRATKTSPRSRLPPSLDRQRGRTEAIPLRLSENSVSAFMRLRANSASAKIIARRWKWRTTTISKICCVPS